MKFKSLTILKSFSILFILGCLLYTAMKWKTLAYEEGWGVVFMIPLFLFGFIGLTLDFILTKMIKNKWLINIIGLVIVLIFSLTLW